MDGVTVILPGGFWSASGLREQRAHLRPLTGADEEFLCGAGRALSPARRTTALLARCVNRLGPDSSSPEAIRALTAGDREALLLHLRRLTFGNRMLSVLTCPACGERMDLELAVDDLLLPPYPEARACYERAVEACGAAYTVRFHLPTGADQETAADLVKGDPGAAVEMLLHRSVERVVDGNGAVLPKEEWPPALGRELPDLLAELDPQAELVLNLSCPSCGRAFSSLFDTAAFFFQELDSGLDRLYREVHVIAWHYHWSEAEIMGMTPRKRRRYLEFISGELGEGSAW